MNHRNVCVKRGVVFILALGLMEIFSAAGSARAAMVDFTVGSQWRGYFRDVEQGGGGGAARFIVLGGSNSSLIGLLIALDKVVPVTIEEAGDGSVDIAGIGANRGFHAHGMSKQTGDGSVITDFTYEIQAVPGVGNSRGRLTLLRSFPPGPCKFPPGPCRGSFETFDGFMGGVSLEINPLTEHPDASIHSGDFSGILTLGDSTYKYVGTESSIPNEDGSFSFDIVGESTNPASVVPCIRIAGRYLPAVQRDGKGRLFGSFHIDSASGKTMDRGIFLLLPAV